MICDAFLERVDALLDGGLTGPDREEMLRHLATCAGCRDLCAALAGAGSTPEDPGLAESILARTSGAACGSARSRLCASVDGELDAFDAELVTGHLRTCPECGGLVRALERLREALPLLAEIDPGPRFLELVLSRTSRRPRRMPLHARIASALEHLLGRPRVAWEGAFVATFVLVALVLAPGSPFSDVPGRGLDLVRKPSPQQRLALGGLRGTLDDLEATFVGGARSVWANGGAVVVENSSTVASGLARGSTSTWETIRRSLGTFPGSDASGQKGGGTGTIDPAPKTAQEKKR